MFYNLIDNKVDGGIYEAETYQQNKLFRIQ